MDRVGHVVENSRPEERVTKTSEAEREEESLLRHGDKKIHMHKRHGTVTAGIREGDPLDVPSGKVIT